MTCANENEEGGKKYSRLMFTEFLEMIGRVAELKFKESELEEMHLANKIEFVLDDLFTCLPSLKRRQVNLIDNVEESYSDEDYWEVWNCFLLGNY